MVDDSSEHKKTKDVNKTSVTTISHSEYKDVLLNKTNVWDIRWIGTYEINKISLSCFDDEIYDLNNGYDGVDLGYEKIAFLSR